MPTMGAIDAEGATFSEIEAEIVARAADLFGSRESALVDITEFRDVYVLGTVQNPGAYEYIPGLNVVKAIALAGGFDSIASETSNSDREIDTTRRRVLDSQTRLEFAQAELDAINFELARLDGLDAPEMAEVNPELAMNQLQLVAMRRELSQRHKDGAEQRRALALDEVELLSERRQLVDAQLQATQDEYTRVKGLFDQGLVRRDALLEVENDLNNLRSDALDVASFEARALQTAANADSSFAVEETEYRHGLLVDKIQAERLVSLESAELDASVAYLRELSPAAVESLGEDVVETVYEIYKSGDDTPVRGTLGTPLGPDDTLIVRFEAVGTQ